MEVIQRALPKLSFSILFINIVIFNNLFTCGIGKNSTSPIYKRLPNEYCKLRETLIRVDQINDKYFPMVVKLHHCDGSCYTHHPTVRKCVALKTQTIAVHVTRMFDRQKHTIHLQNHTSCGCPCTKDKTSCNDETQVWDDRACKCKCKPGASSRHFQCYKPFEWNARSCQCRCNLQCNELQTLDAKQCICNCKPNTYQKCLILNRYFDPETCQCLNGGEKSTGEAKCKGLSNKWLAVLILMGFLVCLTLTFDCILYGKKTGIGFKLLTFCRKRNKKHQEESGNCIPLHKGEQAEA